MISWLILIPIWPIALERKLPTAPAANGPKVAPAKTLAAVTTRPLPAFLRRSLSLPIQDTT